MALIAHWPLNGDTNDYSGNNRITTTTGTITSNTTGKLGRSYTFDNGYLNYNYKNDGIILHQNSTVAMWVKMTSFPSTRTGLFETTYGAEWAINIDSAGGIQWYYGTSGTTATPYTTSGGSTSNVVNNLDEWYHLVFIRDIEAGKLRIYKNGILINEGNYSYEPVQSNNGIFKIGMSYTGNFPGSLNDVRLYDHVLNEFEIHELYKTKILHYTFNEEIESTTNLFSGKTMSIYNNHGVPGSVIDTGDTYRGYPIYRSTMTPNTTTSLNSFKNSTANQGVRVSGNTFVANLPHTSSILWRVKKGPANMIVRGTPSNISGWTDAGTYVTEDGWNRTITTRQPYTTNASDSVFWSFRSPDIELNETIIIDWAAPQLETKDHPTDFTADTRTAPGIRDSSGHMHNATITSGSPHLVTDTEVGFKSVNITSGDIIKIDNLTVIGQMSKTYTAWVKLNSNWGINGNILSGRTGDNNSFLINGNRNVVGREDDSIVTGSTALNTEQWYHVAYVFDFQGTTSYKRVYVNGVLDGSSTDENYTDEYVNNTSYIGYDARFEYYFNGKINDIRLYATALSDKDIKDLYETRAEIEKSGTLIAHDFKQRTNLLEPVNQAIKDKEFKNGLSSYTQANTNVTLTDRGYRIYRTPNVNPTDNGNTMWGGLRINMTDIPGGIPLIKGRSYRLIINTNGKTSNSSSGSSEFSNSMGWGGGGLTPTPITIGREWERIPSNFNGKHDIIWEFKIEDDIYKVCTSSYSGFVAGNIYPSYNHLQMGWGYQNTGSEGTEIYITGIYLYDITDDDSIGISNKGIGTFDEYSTVGITDGLVGYWPLDRNSKNYSENNYTMLEEGVSYNGNSAFFSTYPAYIMTDSTNNISALKEYTYSISIYRTDSQDAFLIMGSRLGNNTYQSLAVIGNKVCLHKYGYNNNSDTNIASSAINLGLNQWYHIVITYNNGDTKTYVNGVLEGTGMHVNSSYSNRNFQFNYETSIDDTYRFFRGYMKDAKVFNRALTPEEIAIEYNTMFNNEVQIHESGVLYAKDLKQY